MHEICALMAVN